jgi:hypothetical protein
MHAATTGTLSYSMVSYSGAWFSVCGYLCSGLTAVAYLSWRQPCLRDVGTG